MAIDASLTGRLRNTSLPKSYPLLPVFEAVVNAVQAIDLVRDESNRGSIVIKVVRSDEIDLFDLKPDQVETISKPIVGFEIADDGEGFHDANMTSFRTLDSEYKASDGCRGVGRLLWLKAFERVEIESIFDDGEESRKHRSFSFTASAGVDNDIVSTSEHSATGTTVRLVGFREKFQARAPKSAATTARSILEHCLWYFVRPGGAPKISVEDERESERIDLDTAFEEYMTSSATTETLQVSEQKFDLLHLRLKPTARSTPTLHWCAANRVVSRENLTGRIPGLHGRLNGPDGEFAYACFLSSQYLDENVRPERTQFEIPETPDGLVADGEPSMSEIRTGVLESIEKHLQESLDEVRRAGRERVENFVNTKSPRYRPILQHIDDKKLSVDPSVGDKDLEIELHRQLADLEGELLVEGQRVLDPTLVRDQDYDKRLNAYLARVEDVKKSDLAAYVSRRKVILELLAQAIEKNDDGKYEREAVVHNLIMPMGTTSDDVSPVASNLWIIDEGLAFHNFLASDKTIKSMPVTGSTSRKEPDILALSMVDSPVLVSEASDFPLASITVVEIKRPMRDDASEGEDKDPIQQAQNYLERVRDGEVRTARGRPIPKSREIPGFLYVLADLTPTMISRCKFASLRPTQDGMGYFGYNENYRAYIEVMSFDRLLRSANQRNRAFFDKLGLPV